MNWDLRNDGKNVQDVRGKINKSIVNVFSLFMTIMLLSMAAPAGNLQAASTQRRQVQVSKSFFKSDICSYDECVQKIFKEKCKK